MHSYKSPQVVYFKGNTCPRCKSLFATEKSANDRYRRNLKRKFCARPRGPDARVRPRTEEKEEKGSSRSKRFLESLDSRLWEIEGRNGRGAGARGGRGAGSKSLPKPEPRKRQTSSHGSKKSDISSWFTKRAFSNQSGQGGPAATDHHRETGPRHFEQAIDHQTKGDVGANAQNVHELGTSSHGDRSVRVRSICSVSPSKRGARSTRSGNTIKRRSCAQERRCWTGRRPEDHMWEHFSGRPQGHAALEVAAVCRHFCFLF